MKEASITEIMIESIKRNVESAYDSYTNIDNHEVAVKSQIRFQLMALKNIEELKKHIEKMVALECKVNDINIDEIWKC